MIIIWRIFSISRFKLGVLAALSLLPFYAVQASTVSFSQILKLDVEDPYVWRSYADQSQQTLAHFTQSAVNANSSGSILLIHGGCWSNAYGVDHALPMAAALSRMGFDVWAAEYRRVGDEGGGWPGSLDDVKAAIRYVAKITNNSPLLVGHSAGGHLALKAAEDPDLSIKGVVALAPITDLIGYGAEKGSCQSMVPMLMGEDSYQPSDRYRNASVRIEEISTPIKAIRGEADSIIGGNQVALFSPEQLLEVPEAGHFDLIYPKSQAFEAVKSVIENLLAAGNVSTGRRPGTTEKNTPERRSSVNSINAHSGYHRDHMKLAGAAE